MSTERHPPYNEEAEQAVISAVLTDPGALDRIRTRVRPEDFYRDRHRHLLDAAIVLSDRGAVIDPVTLSALLIERGHLDAAGGKEYIGFLLDVVPTTANAEHHANIVRELATRRRLIEHLNVASQALWDGAGNVRDITTELSLAITPILAHEQREGFVHVGDDLYQLLESIETQARGGSAKHVVPTGYPEIDDALGGGFERGEFIVFAGVPASAKTGTAMNIALNVARESEGRFGAAVVSAEMTRQKLHRRNLSVVSQVPFSSIRHARLGTHEWSLLVRASTSLKSVPLWVDQTPTPAIEDITAKAKQLKADHPEIALIVVDFIQLVQRALAGRRTREENRSLELTAISYSLKGLAKETDTVVVATCQVDAADIEERKDKKPKLADARWSQGMREAADLWASVYRPKMYDNENPARPDTLELLFQKCRDAEPFDAALYWNGAFMQVTSAKRAEKLRRDAA